MVERSLHKAMDVGPNPTPGTFMDKRPIGVLDSGVGGLTVWHEIQKLLPQESTLYIGDSKHAPYGDRTPDEIFQLARRLIRYLLKKDAKLIIIACNVITTTSLDRVRSEFKGVPLIGTVPVVKKAAEKTRKKKIGILSTNGTARSLYQKHLIEQFARGVEVVNVGNNTLVPLIEQGELEGLQLKGILKRSLAPFLEKNVDVVALGCTHFPFLRKSIQEILGKDILLLDSGAAIARQVERILVKNKMKTNGKYPVHSVFTTGEKEIVESIMQKAKLPIAQVAKVALG